MVNDIVTKSMNEEPLNEEEISQLFKVNLFSNEAGLIQAAARRKSEKACGGFAEVHAQVGLNVAPCPRNCQFCSFAACNGIFHESMEFPVDEIVAKARQFEVDGANAIFIMGTADYSFDRFLEVSLEIKRSLKPETVLVANVGDFTNDRAQKLRETGYSGIYHAVRLGEGRDTSIAPDQRLKTMHVARDVGLSVGTCLEPVGPEHSVEELVEKTIITRDVQPCYSGAARRIPIPGTEMEKKGRVSEARMAHILAVVRLALGYDVPGNCTHEPNGMGAMAGANLLWAESGANPRDTAEETTEQRGMTVAQCRTIFQEADWKVLDGPSQFYTMKRA